MSPTYYVHDVLHLLYSSVLVYLLQCSYSGLLSSTFFPITDLLFVLYLCRLSCFIRCRFVVSFLFFFFFKQKTAYEMRISDWSSDVCSSDLVIGIDVDVAMGEVAGPYARLALADPYVDGDVDLAALHVGGDRRFVIAGSRTALLGDHRAAHRHRHAVAIGLLPGLADRHDDAAPIGVFAGDGGLDQRRVRSEEHTSELQSLMRISYAVFCLKKKTVAINKRKTKQKDRNN